MESAELEKKNLFNNQGLIDEDNVDFDTEPKQSEINFDEAF
jgi:hypothetical protein